MLHENFRLINEEFTAESVSPEQMDRLWAAGWRHFGTRFFRYNVGILGTELRFVIPLRICLEGFTFSKSQRRLLRRNRDLTTLIEPILIDSNATRMFDRHKRRFDHGIPDSIYDFLSRDPAVSPCEGRQVRVFENDRLVAISYFDRGAISVSGVYGMFEPELASRGLGIFTLLKEIEFALTAGCRYYYLGYAYAGRSFYDYKKRFRASEAFDWYRGWLPYDGSDALHISDELI